MHEVKDKKSRKITLADAFIVFAFLIVSMLSTILLFGGKPHIPLVASIVVASTIGMLKGFSWAEIEAGIIDSIASAMASILMLLVVGIIIGTWTLGGVVPTMIYYGLVLLSPKIFLVTACAICGVVSLFTGSSWGTLGTVGVALLGVGRGLGIPDGLIVGALISGSYFGDKLSPLSDTTNLAPAVSGATLFDHVRHMMYTTIPSILIAMAIYGVLGLKFAGTELDYDKISILRNAISGSFKVSLLMFLPPAVVIMLVIRKVPALPGLMVGAILGAVCAALFQGAGMADIIRASHLGVTVNTGVAEVDKLLSGGGINSMLGTTALGLLALSFNGVIERIGVVNVVIERIIKFADTDGKLIFSTLLTSLFINFASGVQKCAIALPGRMYKDIYRQRGLAPKNLSRCCEDAGTVAAPLVPYSTDAAFLSGTFGVDPMMYIPYCFFSMISPIISMIFGFTGFSIAKLSPEEMEKIAQEEAAASNPVVVG